tara:strand:+ start:694 stop:801 length:108 start_codon:yes stop_codon:yes gene_type:complete
MEAAKTMAIPMSAAVMTIQSIEEDLQVLGVLCVMS